MRRIRKVLFFMFFFVLSFGYTQIRDSLSKNQKTDPIKDYQFDSDSVISKESVRVERTKDSVSVDIMLVNIYGLPKFNNELDKRLYYWLKDRVYAVYPYFVIAVKQYKSIQDSLESHSIKKDKNFKRYIEKRQKELSDEYETKLKSLTRTEGRIFSKLMYRATGKTVYDIIKELRGGWSAFWWNVKAGAFDIDLKEPFDPVYNREDSYVEAILLRAYQFNELKPINYL